MDIRVIGAGAWGTALAINAARSGHSVTLWARDAAQVASMQLERRNLRYLGAASFPDGLWVKGGEMAFAVQEADLIVIGTPMAGLRAALASMQGVRAPVAWLCKGFEAAGQADAVGLLGHEVCSRVAPNLHFGVLSGPSFAAEVAQGMPTALVAASHHGEVIDSLVRAFHASTLRVYASSDVIGVEVGGAVKNVLAIATGLCDGLSLGLNARAALITRGLAEMTRLGLALGARADTFAGLSGLGDLVLTATGDLSRNRRVGQLLAQGHTLAQAVDSLGHVAEGVYSARTVLQRARSLGVDMPICELVVALIDGQLPPAQAVAQLMGRAPKEEGC